MHPAKANDLTVLRSYAYRVAPEVNGGKLDRLEAMQIEWSRTLQAAWTWYWSPFLNGGVLPYKPKSSGPLSTFPATQLVTSQKNIIAAELESQAKSWSSNLKNRVSRSIMASGALRQDAQLRREMLWINAMKLWLLPYPKQCELLASQPSKEGQLVSLSLSASRTMRRLVRRYIDTYRLPDPAGIPMQVNQLSGSLSGAARTQSSFAPRWLKISTLERREQISLPIMANGYADGQPGEMATTFKLIKREDQWQVIVCKKSKPDPWTTHSVDVLGIDLGLRNLMATSEGDIRFANFMDVLHRYDAQLIKIQKGLQGAGIYRLSSCKRYRLFAQRLQGFLKTSMQTHLMALLEQHRPKKVVIEDLLFAGERGTLSRRMNRLLRRFGQRYFTQTLAEKAVKFGFEIEAIDPAYSSQACKACGFVHRSNRVGSKFKCISCGHTAHADVNAAKNLAGRSSGEAALQCDRRTRWSRALKAWSAAQLCDMTEAPPGSARHHRAVGRARAGLQCLASSKSSALKLNAKIRPQLLSAARAASLDDLLNGLRLCESLDSTT